MWSASVIQNVFLWRGRVPAMEVNAFLCIVFELLMSVKTFRWTLPVLAGACSVRGCISVESISAACVSECISTH